MHTGSCSCGAVTVTVNGDFEHAAQACHCSQCRKQSGHFLAAVNVRRSALQIDGLEQVAWFRSSAEVERGFCSVCGATLFWKPTMDGYEWTGVAMGLFDGPTDLRIAKHTFVVDKGDYYDIDDGMPQSDAY